MTTIICQCNASERNIELGTGQCRTCGRPMTTDKTAPMPAEMPRPPLAPEAPVFSLATVDNDGARNQVSYRVNGEVGFSYDPDPISRAILAEVVPKLIEQTVAFRSSSVLGCPYCTLPLVLHRPWCPSVMIQRGVAELQAQTQAAPPQAEPAA